jgi:hypothetical protein
MRADVARGARPFRPRRLRVGWPVSANSSDRAPKVTPVPVANLSEEAAAIVERERAQVAARVHDLRRQSEAFHTLVAEIDADLTQQERTLRHMDELLGLAPQLALEANHEELRGQRLREIAVELLRQRCGAEAEIHYLDWLALLEAEGIRVGGKSRTATFLTQIRKAGEVESVRPRSGIYRLKSAY